MALQHEFLWLFFTLLYADSSSRKEGTVRAVTLKYTKNLRNRMNEQKETPVFTIVFHYHKNHISLY